MTRDDATGYRGITSCDDRWLFDALATVRTHFVYDRIRETAFEDRAYIADLLQCEHYVIDAGGHPRGFAANVVWHAMRRAYAPEIRAITDEVQQGIYTPPDQFRAEREAYWAEIQAERDEAARRAADAAARSRQALEERWAALGGRPPRSLT